MLFRQVVHEDLGCASYLVGDETAGVAAVVDPRLDIEPYLRIARYVGVEIAHVLETHTHADHVSGGARLAEATGATRHVHALAGATYPHEPFQDGWRLALGDVVVEALHTPGHRPEHTAFLLTDTARGDRPWAILSGDSLFVGDVARPDLAVEREEGARTIFGSLHERLLSLAPEVELWPGHLGGSMCGGPGLDLKASSTIGYERAANPLLSEPDEDRFVARTLAALGPQPPNFRAIVERNRLGEASFEPEPAALTPAALEAAQAEGAMVVDVREDVEFDEAHVPGALAITARHSGFGTRLAWLSAPGTPILLVGGDDDEARRAAALALSVGVQDIAGFLAGGMAAWREEGRSVERIERLPISELPARLAAEGEIQVLDVREDHEWRAGHLAESLHVPYHELRGLPEGLDPQRPVAVVCASGQRSAIAASALQREGARRPLHVVGGGVQDVLESGT